MVIITIHTKYASLVWLKNTKNLRGMLFRWSLKLSMFESEITYERGSTNVEAHILFRNPISHFIRPVGLLLNSNEIINMQEKDNVCSKNYET